MVWSSLISRESGSIFSSLSFSDPDSGEEAHALFLADIYLSLKQSHSNVGATAANWW